MPRHRKPTFRRRSSDFSAPEGLQPTLKNQPAEADAAGTAPASVIDVERLRRQGAMALRRSREGFVVEAVKAVGIDRPWSPAAADESGAEAMILTRPATPRAIDATPSEADLQAEE